MSEYMARGITIGLALLVLVVGLLIFASAGQPMNAAAEVAQSWIDALCNGDYDTLYGLSYQAREMDAITFRERAVSYVQDSQIPTNCAGEVNLNLVRNIPVPIELAPEVTEIRYFAQILIFGPAGLRQTMPLWAYLSQDGDWTIRADFLGPALVNGVKIGEQAALKDVNGVTIGFVEITDQARVVTLQDRYLIGVPVVIQTLSQTWQSYESLLYSDDRRLEPLRDSNRLPESLRGDFMVGGGRPVPQFLRENGVMWYETERIQEPVMLAFIGITRNSGLPHWRYLDVQLGEAEDNPNALDQYIGMVQLNAADSERVVFDALLDASKLEGGQITISCTSFVVQLRNDVWHRANACNFVPDVWTQVLLPGERLRVEIAFNGYGISPSDLRALSYRAQDGQYVERYTLWSNPDSNPVAD